MILTIILMLPKSSLVDVIKLEKTPKEQETGISSNDKISRQRFSKYLLELLNFLLTCSELFWHCVDSKSSGKPMSLQRPLSRLSLLSLISEI